MRDEHTISQSPTDALVVSFFADENHALRERIVSLETDVATYRELTNATLDALSDLTVQHKRLREQHHQVQSEYRALRERILLADTDVAA